jgi:hypothetical protein
MYINAGIKHYAYNLPVRLYAHMHIFLRPHARTCTHTHTHTLSLSLYTQFIRFRMYHAPTECFTERPTVTCPLTSYVGIFLNKLYSSVGAGWSQSASEQYHDSSRTEFMTAIMTFSRGSYVCFLQSTIYLCVIICLELINYRHSKLTELLF